MSVWSGRVKSKDVVKIIKSASIETAVPIKCLLNVHFVFNSTSLQIRRTK